MIRNELHGTMGSNYYINDSVKDWKLTLISVQLYTFL